MRNMYKMRGYPDDHWFFDDPMIFGWLWTNDIKYTHMVSWAGHNGFVFSNHDDLPLLMMRWG